MKVIRESSQFRIVWDFFILVLILVSCVLIPFQIAFEHISTSSTNKLTYIIDGFFWLDIGLNFFTSYCSSGQEITDLKEIKKHYIRNVLFVDLFANFPLELFFLNQPTLGINNISLILIVRILRLFRIVRLYIIFSRWESQHWINPGYLRIIKFLLTVLLLTHWIACLWFLIAFMDNFPKDSWVVVTGIKDAPIAKQYIVSLYWAFTTMTTIGYGDITPNRTIEYLVTIIIMFLGASIYALIIGNIASLISQIDSAKIRHNNRVDALIQYLSYHQVPLGIIAQIRNYYDYIWNRHRGLNKDDIFFDLPESLKIEVLLHITQELLVKVPLFRHSSPVLRNVLLTALELQSYPPNSYVVSEGEIGENIYFITEGKVEILSNKGENSHGILEEGEYFGDLSLVLAEKRTASVRTLTYCEIFILARNNFNYIKNKYPEFREVLRKSSSEKTEKMSDFLLEGIIL
jgi:hypothetical protein